MALFMSGTAREKAAEPDPALIKNLQEKIKAMEDRSRISAKYGSGLKEEQIAEYLELEDRERRHKIEGEQGCINSRKEQERIQEETIAAVTAAVKSGKLIVRVNGQRVRELPDIRANCPSCGGYLPRHYEALYRAGEMARAPPAGLPAVISAGRGHYGDHPGMWTTGETCTCGTETAIEIQYIFI
jgi:hypothetical protein